LLRVADTGRPRSRHVVTVAIMQKNGAGVHTTHSCYWDTVTDGALMVKWPGDKAKDQNKTMYCIVSVFGLSF
jgi:dynein light chain Tctex-type 1